MLPRPQAFLPQGATRWCYLGSPSSTCHALFSLTPIHWQLCCCFVSLDFVPSFGSRALDSFTTISSLGYSTTTVSILETRKRCSQRFHTTICKGFYDLGRDPVILLLLYISPLPLSLPRECPCIVSSTDHSIATGRQLQST